MVEKRVYLFYGSDSYLIRSKTFQIITKYEVDDFNVTIYDAEETNISNALSDAQTIPFMSPMKIIIVKNCYFLTGEKVKKEINHDLDALSNYIENPVEETILILNAPYGKLDERKAITKVLRNKAEISECVPMNQVDLASWVRRQLGKENIKIEREALDEFLRRVEHDTEVAVSEMKKLLLYAEDLDHVNLDIIKRVITKNVEDNVYEITNNILDNNRSKALEIYNDLVQHSEDPLRILGILVNKYREILYVKLLIKDGKDKTDIANYYHTSSGRAYYMIKNAQSVNMGTVKKHLRKLEEIDYQIKTGQIDKKIGLELFILGT
jgi:DNA polymerase-3 subunit delta